MNPVQAGDRDPAFTAQAHDGREVSLADLRGKHVVDTQGVVRHVFNSQFAADRHVAEALAVVQKLAVESSGAAGAS